jgi:hypothetical protein
VLPGHGGCPAAEDSREDEEVQEWQADDEEHRLRITPEALLVEREFADSQAEAVHVASSTSLR